MKWKNLLSAIFIAFFLPSTILPTARIQAQFIDQGGDHAIVLCDDGTVWAVGLNNFGQLGDGTTTNRTTPVQVSGLSDIIAVAAGLDHSMALQDDGTVWTWGRNVYGALGDGTSGVSNFKAIPMQVLGLLDIIAIDAGFRYSVAVRNDGTVWGWGHNGVGRLGDGTSISRTIPVQAYGLTNIIAIVAEYAHTMALKSDGTVWAWGDNRAGQLGIGTVGGGSLIPVQVIGLSNITEIAIGSTHSLAVEDDNRVWAWGRNNYGQLGNGTIGTPSCNCPNPIPVQVLGLTNIIDIAAGIHHSLAVHNNGTVWAWGANNSGQLGDGTVITRATPVQVSLISNITIISAKISSSLALQDNGTVWGWGRNSRGQLGDSTRFGRVIPVQMLLTCTVGGPIACDGSLASTITGTNVSCNGGSDGAADLTVTGGTLPYNFSWSNGAATEDISGLSAGTYNVTVTDANGCTTSASVTITEPPVLIADAGSDVTICSKESVIIGGSPTASGGTAPFVYSWSPAIELSSTTIANPTASPSSTTIYTVTVTDANGCVEINDITIIVNPNPIVDAGSDQIVLFSSCPPPGPPESLRCVDLAATVIGGTPPYNFAWNPVTGLNDPNILNPEACPTVTTTYVITVTDANGCTATGEVTVNAVDFCDLSLYQCNNGGQVIQICHVADCTSKCVNKNANCDSPNSLCAHLLHGDNLGPCFCKKGQDITKDEEVAKSTEAIKTKKMMLNAYPNPFSYSTTIRFSLPEAGKATLEIYNLLGSKIAVLFEDFADKYNTYTVEFQGKELPAGIYFYKLTTGEGVFYNKLILSR